MPFKDKNKQRASAAKSDAAHILQIRERRILNYQKDKQKHFAYHRKYMTRIRIEVLTHYGNGKLACIKCGFNDIRALTLDHINGGGREHMRSIKSTEISIWVRKHDFPIGFQTLCMNCQFIKRSENHEMKKGDISNTIMPIVSFQQPPLGLI
jgi:hypothetical protein